MGAHKYWQALCMSASTPETLELSEFHLYNGATRVDPTATLTASVAPSGTLTNLGNDAVGNGCYWASGGDLVILSWEFSSPQEVTGIVLGSRTTSARWPTALVLRGGDYATGSGDNPEYLEYLAFAVPYFVSAAKTAVLAPLPIVREFSELENPVDVAICGGAGFVPYVTEQEILPRTTPQTFKPQWARVQLARFIDGRVIQEQWSDPVTGEGVFHTVDENYLYTVTAIYPDSGMRAVVADRVQPEVYPS